jgi:hypothetical protein
MGYIGDISTIAAGVAPATRYGQTGKTQAELDAMADAASAAVKARETKLGRKLTADEKAAVIRASYTAAGVPKSGAIQTDYTAGTNQNFTIKPGYSINNPLDPAAWTNGLKIGAIFGQTAAQRTVSGQAAGDVAKVVGNNVAAVANGVASTVVGSPSLMLIALAAGFILLTGENRSQA